MLSNNKIMSISHGSLPSNLVTLEMRANPIKNIHESAIKNLRRLKKLYVFLTTKFARSNDANNFQFLFPLIN